MKLLNFTHPDFGPEELMGVVYNDEYALPIRSIFIEVTGKDEPFLNDTLSFVKDQENAQKQIEAVLESISDDKLQSKVIALSEVTFLPSIRPIAIRDTIGFKDHIANCVNNYVKNKSKLLHLFNQLSLKLRGRPITGVPKEILVTPFFYFANINSVAGSGCTVEIPDDETSMDFELELGAVIGKKGKNISQLDAHDYIAGYTIFNDLSARDTQLSYMKGNIGPGKGKSFDNGNVLGPFYVTADEIADLYNLGMRAWINGKQHTDNSMATMSLRFDAIINKLSQKETLYPGEIIGSGTVPWGSTMEHGSPLESGDLVELEIDHLGRQSVSIA
jgi:2-keto-4-pentenoate hydratase/2-oxohepta-3-ene-1,7-dioic acid hydratase in catechol pathway